MVYCCPDLPAGLKPRFPDKQFELVDQVITMFFQDARPDQEGDDMHPKTNANI